MSSWLAVLFIYAKRRCAVEDGASRLHLTSIEKGDIK